MYVYVCIYIHTYVYMYIQPLYISRKAFVRHQTASPLAPPWFSLSIRAPPLPPLLLLLLANRHSLCN